MRDTLIIICALLIMGKQWGIAQSISTNIPTDNHAQLSVGFTSPVLTPFQLEGFERRALQKLSDVQGYLAVMGNPFYEDEFRNQAKEMLGESFHEGTAHFWHPFSLGSLGFEAFADFFVSMTEAQYFTIEFSEEEALGDPKLQETGYYEGEIRFQFAMLYQSNKPHRAEGKGLYYRIRYRVERVPKSFGETEKLVWTVHLGDLEKN